MPILNRANPALYELTELFPVGVRSWEEVNDENVKAAFLSVRNFRKSVESTNACMGDVLRAFSTYTGPEYQAVLMHQAYFSLKNHCEGFSTSLPDYSRLFHMVMGGVYPAPHEMDQKTEEEVTEVVERGLSSIDHTSCVLASLAMQAVDAWAFSRYPFLQFSACQFVNFAYSKKGLATLSYSLFDEDPNGELVGSVSIYGADGKRYDPADLPQRISDTYREITGEEPDEYGQ